MAVPKKVRFEVFKRDGFACQYCGQTPPAVLLEADHIFPKSKGGPDVQENLLTCCRDCNRGKGDRGLDEIPVHLQARHEEQREAALQAQSFNEFLLSQRRQQDATIERLGVYWYDQFENEKGKYVFAERRTRSIRAFLKGLTEAEILEAMDVAISWRLPAGNEYDDRTWRYFCGVCWRRIRGQGGEE